MTKVLKHSGKVYSCNNCGLMVRTDCREYFCPTCGNVIIGEGAYAQQKDLHKVDKYEKKDKK